MKEFIVSLGGGRRYQSPEMAEERITPEAGCCNSAIGGNTNESINDDKQYEFEF